MRGAAVAGVEPTLGTTVVVGQLFRVRRGKEKRFVATQPLPPARSPARVALQLALAHRIQKAIEAGEIRDQAEAARLLGLTRARVSQLLDLTLLAPDIQERLLDVEAGSLSERALQAVSGIKDWNRQRRALTGSRCVRTHRRSGDRASSLRPGGDPAERSAR